MANLKKHIKSAKKSIRAAKRCCAYLFPEYQELLTAKAELKQAQERYHKAKQAWQALGEDDD